jgi:hypothetical protein
MGKGLRHVAGIAESKSSPSRVRARRAKRSRAILPLPEKTLPTSIPRFPQLAARHCCQRGCVGGIGGGIDSEAFRDSRKNGIAVTASEGYVGLQMPLLRFHQQRRFALLGSVGTKGRDGACGHIAPGLIANVVATSAGATKAGFEKWEKRLRRSLDARRPNQTVFQNGVGDGSSHDVRA